MRILLTGANGFIGSQIASALSKAGHDVIATARSTGNSSKNKPDLIYCNYAEDIDMSVWLPRLEGIDAIVNCVGILREGGRGSFDSVHCDAPVALFRACAQKGIKKVIQISAIGDSEDSEFIHSKHKADAILMGMDLDWVVIRPSVVYSVRGSYGGTSLIRAMAATPGVLFIPGKGEQLLQPVSGDDLGRIVVKAIEDQSMGKQLLEAVSPAPVCFEDYLLSLRNWLGFESPKLIIHIPLWFIKIVAMLGEWFGNGPLGLTMYNMLQRSNVASSGGYEKLKQVVGFDTHNVEEVCRQSASFVQDRWHARLYFLRPVLRVFIALLWIASGIIGFVLPLSDSAPVIQALGLSANIAPYVIYSASSIDLILGMMWLTGFGFQLAGVLMLISLFAYTLILGIAMPALWIEPFGSLIKNVPLIPAVMVMMVIKENR